MASYHLHKGHGKKGSAADRSIYIAREGKYQHETDVVATGHGNMPSWATEPKDYWRAADRHIRSNGSTYTGYDVALPEELPLKQNIALLDDFIRIVAPGKPYQYAVHVPDGAISGEPQPHAHLMISEVIPNGIERPADRHFKRYNPVDPEAGGCRKDNCGQTRRAMKAGLSDVREQWARVQNAHLARNGHNARVDHRSYADRDIDQAPEKHLGAVKTRDLSGAQRALLRANRSPRGR